METNPQPNNHQNTILKQLNQRLTQQNHHLNQKVKLLQQQMAQLLISQNKTIQQSKQQVAPKKCSHGHHDHNNNHGHNHSHGHGHGHGHGHKHQSSQEQENPSGQTNVVIPPPIQRSFLQKIFKTQQEINFRYFRLPIKTIKAWKKDENIDLTKNKSCMLHLRQMKLDVSQFVKQIWQDVEWINLPQCEIDDQGWKIIVQHAQKSFPDLRVIGIRWNKIKTINEGDLQQFKSLRMIDLGLQSEENNPLSQQSRQIIKKFMENHPHIKVQ